MKTGSKVRLKSGGPLMTVNKDRFEEIKESMDTRVPCIWFDNDQHVQKASFEEETLDLVD